MCPGQRGLRLLGQQLGRCAAARAGRLRRFPGALRHKYVVPAINNGSAVLTDLLGGPIQYNDTYKGVTNLYNGFPGFDGMFPKVTLSYVAQMLEAAFRSSTGTCPMPHDQHVAAGDFAYGPGEQGYNQQLQDYNAGWRRSSAA